MMISNDAKALIALTTRLGDRHRPSLSPTEWHKFGVLLQDAGLRPVDVFDTDPGDVAGVEPEISSRVALLVENAAAATLEADELNHKGVWITTLADDDYPPTLLPRLGAKTPPVLFAVGNPKLLETPGIGIVGSREITEAGAEVARELARVAVSLERPVVSGGARGVDQLAMNSAFMQGGHVIGVLADSLLSRIRKPDMLEALDEGRTCLLTQQTPSAGFTPAAAMSRNKLIYGLADVTVVVASDVETGGTWAGATEALRAGNGVVAVWRGEGEGPGNRILEGQGALPIKNFGDVDRLLSTPLPESSEQLALLDRDV
jgi:predicted Rossmann fold nucleotide-binding protein DprA/Smf involved in DNA uptake